MNKLLSALGFILLLNAFNVSAQDFDNYQYIRSAGNVPEKFITTSTEKYKEESKKHISDKDKKYIKKTKDEFFLRSSFAIDQLLLSGKVMFNDPVSLYVNKVMDELLKDDKTLRNKVEVYVVKSSSVNAFTTNNGLIFVCMGLIAQLENEAQLAYVLSHELVHYQKQHALDELIENTNIERGAGKYRQHSYDEKILARSNYSKEKETESDLEGLKLYMKTNYDLETIDGVFDVLQYAYLPFDEVPFKKDFLETKNLKFPDSYFLKETKDIEPLDDDDSLSTHPAVKIRREQVGKQIKDADNKKRKKYIVGENEFFKAQKTCRYELVAAYLQNREYDDALYSAYLLLQDNPNSIYLKKGVLKALYGLSKYASAERWDEVHESYEDIQGSIQQVHYLFDQLTSEEISVTALTYAWNLKKQYPKDEEIKDITEDLFKQMVTEYFENKSDFYTTPRVVENKTKPEGNVSQKTTQEDEENEEESSTKKKNKYDKIKEKKIKAKEDGEVTEDDFIKYAFVDELKEKDFNDEYERQVKEKEKEEKALAKTKSKDYKKEQKRTEERNERLGYALGLKKVVFVNPFYYKVNALKESVHRVNSEAAQKSLNEKLQANAKLAGLNYEIIDKKDLKVGSVETFNDMAFLNDYINLTFDNDELKMVHHQQDELRKLGQRYNTRYFCWTGIVATKEVAFQKTMAGCYLMLVYPLMPYVVYKLARPEYNTTFYTIVLDTETGKSIMKSKQEYKFSDRDDVVNSSLYDLCLQLKNTRKK
jgi:hypothetical protein